MSKWILAAIVTLAISIPSLAKDEKNTNSGKAEDQIKALMDQNRQAALRSDAGFLEKNIADNYVSVAGNGKTMTRDELIAARKSGEVKYDSINLRDQKIRVFGNTAVVNTDADVTGTAWGQPMNGEYRATHVLVKQDGVWKFVSYQATPVESTASASSKK